MRRRPSEARARPGVSLAVDVFSAVARLPLAREAVARAVRTVLRSEGVARARVSVAFVSNARIAGLNRRHLGHRGATDVLSFTLTPAVPGEPLVGDLYIAPDVARANARASGTAVREEILRLVIHGALHLAGHDHAVDDGRERSAMWRRQERFVRRLSRAGGRTP